MAPNGTDAGPPNGTNATGGGGGGPLAKPGGAPNLPDVVPDGVQSLLDGIFSFGGELGRRFGSVVSDLAGGIGAESATVVASHALDLVGVVL